MTVQNMTVHPKRPSGARTPAGPPAHERETKRINEPGCPRGRGACSKARTRVRGLLAAPCNHRARGLAKRENGSDPHWPDVPCFCAPLYTKDSVYQAKSSTSCARHYGAVNRRCECHGEREANHGSAARPPWACVCPYVYTGDVEIKQALELNSPPGSVGSL